MIEQLRNNPMTRGVGLMMATGLLMSGCTAGGGDTEARHAAPPQTGVPDPGQQTPNNQQFDPEFHDPRVPEVFFAITALTARVVRCTVGKRDVHSELKTQFERTRTTYSNIRLDQQEGALTHDNVQGVMAVTHSVPKKPEPTLVLAPTVFFAVGTGEKAYDPRQTLTVQVTTRPDLPELFNRDPADFWKLYDFGGNIGRTAVDAILVTTDPEGKVHTTSMMVAENRKGETIITTLPKGRPRQVVSYEEIMEWSDETRLALGTLIGLSERCMGVEVAADGEADPEDDKR